MQLTPDVAIDRALEFLTQDAVTPHLGVAVSGGSDSLALLVLAHDWAKRHAFTVSVATVDHKLRTGAAAEIARVAEVCANLEVSHDVLSWTGWDGVGNLQAKARTARYDLLEHWGEALGTDFILLGHTADDQAETVLMNLARGSGVDGLSAMAECNGPFLRPLLRVGRDELRTVLRARSLAWCDDPTNEDATFERVKARQMMANLADLGLTRARLVQTANHMQSAQRSLRHAAYEAAKVHVLAQGGDLLLPKRMFYGIGEDTEARIIAGALMWIGRQTYRPRYRALCDMAQAVASGESRTLHGSCLKAEGDVVRVSREIAALAAMPDRVFDVLRDGHSTWDGRWTVTADKSATSSSARLRGALPRNGMVLRHLGEAISDVSDWRDVGLPRASLMATPAIFHGDTLVAAPVAGLRAGFDARIVADFPSFLL